MSKDDLLALENVADNHAASLFGVYTPHSGAIFRACWLCFKLAPWAKAQVAGGVKLGVAAVVSCIFASTLPKRPDRLLYG